MLRALVVLLLLANALVLAWSFGVLDGLLGRRPDADREPERLQRQVNPELVNLLPLPGQGGASAPAAAGLASPAATASPAASSAASAAASAVSSSAAPTPVLAVAASAAAGESVCLEAGPLPAAAVAGAEKALLATGGAAGSWTSAPAAAKGVYLIYMGRYEDDETLQRKLEELKRRRIDGHPVRHAELQPGIEVARFDDKEEAEQALARLSQRGLRTARVLTLAPPQPQRMLRLAAVEPARADVLATVKLAPGVEGFRRCAPPVAKPAPERQAQAGASVPTSPAVPALLDPAARPAATRVRASVPEGGTGGPVSAGAAVRAGAGAAAGSATAAP